MRRRRLNSFADVRRYLADIAHRLESGIIDSKIADSLRNVCNAVVFSLKEEISAKRLDLLEANTAAMQELIAKLEGAGKR